MSMVSPQLRASLIISFSKFVIFDIVRRVLGKEITEAGIFFVEICIEDT